MAHTAVGISDPTDATKTAAVLAAAPGSDSGQSGLAVRVISQLGAGSGGGGGAATIADGADVAEGATSDAAVVTNTTGTISGKLRGLVAWAYGRMPAALGQTTMSGSLPVALASDQSALTVTAGGATGTVTSPASVTTSVATVLAQNTSRKGATVYNESGAICYLKLGSAASLTSYTVQVAIGGYYEVPFGYTGILTGITVSSTAVLRVTEIT